MPRSPFFIRIKSDVLKLVHAIPEGKVCTYASIGDYLDVVPRHVAYILATLEPLESVQYPWHRVVGGNGKLGKIKRNEAGAAQSELLREEGILVSANSVEKHFESVFVTAGELKSGVSRQSRPPDAPAARPARTKAARR